MQQAAPQRINAQATAGYEMAVDWQRVEVAAGKIELSAIVRLTTAMPAQNEQLPSIVEDVCDDSGQAWKRVLYRQIIERADLELVLSERDGKEDKGIQRIGTRAYRYKTSFGCVPTRRIRIKHKADGSTETPCARVWKTKRVRITPGLKKAVCNLALKESYGSTLQQIVRQTGEEKILSKSSIINIVHQAGAEISAAAVARADEIFAADNTTKILLGDASVHLAEEHFEAVFLPGEDLTSMDARQAYEKIEWEAKIKSQQVAGSAASECVTEQIIVQVDEVVIRKQPGGKRDKIVHYHGTINTATRTYYCQGETAAQLIYQVASILATLALHNGNKRVLVLSDTADWINNWLRGIGIAEKEGVLCWWHLRARCRELIGEAFTDKDDRAAVRKIILKYLWRGQSNKALSYLKKLITDVADGESRLSVRSIAELTAIKNYLIKRQGYIPDYQARRKRKEWIASTQIEKFNELSISARCKGQGRRWSHAGVNAIAALEVARRNGELDEWHKQRDLPAWPRAA